jgi:phenylacetate-coenzyme A ligase PaaK-like adenylate-forming protein
MTTTLADPAAVQRLAGELSARDNWPRRDLVAIQQRGVEAMLRHAASTSIYYRDTIGAAVRAGAQLADLPVLTKRALMDHWNQIVTDPRVALRDVEAHLAGDRCGEPLLGEYRAFATGGTTGERAVIVYDRDAWRSTIANVFRWVQTMGARPGTRLVGIGAPTPLHITNQAFAELRSGRSDAPRLSVLTPLPELVNALNAYQPEMVITYPSFVRRLIEEQEAGRLQIRPTRVSTSAEVVTNDVRERVRETWNALVIDSYGTTETGLIGTECDAVTGLHLSEDMLVYEVVDHDGRRVPDGMAGTRILVTTLFNRALPLIRYEISDIATFESGPCACGRPYGRVTAIEGRREDYMTLRALVGGTIRIHAARLRAPLAGVPGLRQFQVVPAVDRLTLRITVRGGADAGGTLSLAEHLVRSALREMGADVLVTTELVESIARAGTGAKEKLVEM